MFSNHTSYNIVVIHFMHLMVTHMGTLHTILLLYTSHVFDGYTHGYTSYNIVVIHFSCMSYAFDGYTNGTLHTHMGTLHTHKYTTYTHEYTTYTHGYTTYTHGYTTYTHGYTTYTRVHYIHTWVDDIKHLNLTSLLNNSCSKKIGIYR